MTETTKNASTSPAKPSTMNASAIRRTGRGNARFLIVVVGDGDQAKEVKLSDTIQKVGSFGFKTSDSEIGVFAVAAAAVIRKNNVSMTREMADYQPKYIQHALALAHAIH